MHPFVVQMVDSRGRDRETLSEDVELVDQFLSQSSRQGAHGSVDNGRLQQPFWGDSRVGIPGKHFCLRPWRCFAYAQPFSEATATSWRNGLGIEDSVEKILAEERERIWAEVRERPERLAFLEQAKGVLCSSMDSTPTERSVS